MSLLKLLCVGDEWEGLLDLIHRMVKEYPYVILAVRTTPAPSGPSNQSPTKEHGVSRSFIHGCL